MKNHATGRRRLQVRSNSHQNDERHENIACGKGICDCRTLIGQLTVKSLNYQFSGEREDDVGKQTHLPDREDALEPYRSSRTRVSRPQAVIEGGRHSNAQREAEEGEREGRRTWLNIE